MQVKGRYLVIGWTMVFLAVAGVVVLRTHRAFQVRGELSAVRDSVQALRATRDKVSNGISLLERRGVLGAHLRELGFRMPSDSEVIHLQIPADH